MMLNSHPAPGLGDLLPGFFVVPQNPITDRGPTTYVPRIGEILPGSFPVPQNPIKDYMTGRLNLIGRETGVPGTINGKGVSGIGCGCGGSCGSCSGGLSGISEDWAAIQANITAGNYGAVLQNTVFGIPVWAVAAGLGLMFFMGGEQHSYYGRSRRAARAARAAYA
jgi:hypothetical protein